MSLVVCVRLLPASSDKELCLRMIWRVCRAGLTPVAFALTVHVTAMPATAQSGADGSVVGTVVDAETGKGIAGAGIEETGSKIRVGTDGDGRFRLELKPGSHELRVVAPFYRARTLVGLAVKAGADTRADVELEPTPAGEIELLEVVADAYGGSEASQLLERKLAPTLSDNISAQMIKLSPDSDVAEIIQRVPAVTIRDNKYLNVRGLNERYTAALLNKSRLPSTDPQTRAVPLDLFPASFVESISVIKTYTPDLPGDFSGGLAEVTLNRYPEEFALDVGISTSGNTNTTFQRFDTYKGAGAADWFGYGDKFRDLPGYIPAQNIQRPPPAQQRAYAARFRDIWALDQTTAPPNFGINASIGGMATDDLGAALGVTYSTEWKRRNDEIAREFLTDGTGQLIAKDDFTYDRSDFETELGFVGSAGYDLGEAHSFSLRSIYNRSSVDQVLVGNGTTANIEEPLGTHTYFYTANELALGQLSAQHRLGWIDVDWRSALSRTTQNQPDGRFDTRLDPDGVDTWSPAAQGGRRVFGRLAENMTDSAIDFTIPFKTDLSFTDVWDGLDGSFKFGPAYMWRARTHGLRQFTYSRPGTLVDLSEPTEELLVPQNILTPGGFVFSEVTQPRDSFKASQEIAAIYGMFDLPLFGGWQDADGDVWHQLRLVAGVRGEYSYIATQTKDNSGNPIKPILNDLDPLPGVSLIYSPTDEMNLRFAYSRAVARPELRELSPVQYPAPGGLRPLAGNENLVSSSIESFDVRWEWFLSANEILSAGVFYKDLQDPIEAIVINQGSNNVDSFVNADSATLVGVELESRLDLHRFTDYLDGFSLLANATYVHSNVKIPDAGVGTDTTSDDRELQGQAPYIVNLSLDYTHPDWGTARVLYNTIGKRLSAVGENPLPDIFEQRRDQIDLVFITEINPFGTPLTAKLGVENLLNDDYVFDEGGEITRKYDTGVKVSFGLSYSY